MLLMIYLNAFSFTDKLPDRILLQAGKVFKILFFSLEILEITLSFTSLTNFDSHSAT